MAALNSQRQKLKMQQKLTPQQLLLMRLLQLPVTNLEQKIKEEVEKNPMLEVDTLEPQDQYGSLDSSEQNDTTDDEGDFKGINIDEYYDDDDYSYREQLEKDRNVEDRQIDYANSITFTESLQRQLDLHNLTEKERAIGNELIGSIDGTGYLGRDLQLIANDLAFRAGIDVSNEEIEKVLKLIQSFDPAGVGARNLQECLSLQLHRIPDTDDNTLTAIKIVDRYFSQLTNKHYSSLITLLKIDEKQLNEALGIIRRLNPKPGWGREEENKGAHYIIPDFIVSREGGQLTFTLSDRNRPKLHINSEYTEMMEKLDCRKKLNSSEQETLQFIKAKTESAKWLIDTIDQRYETLTTTMEAIVKYQQNYFLSGDTSDLRPMRLKDIAAITGYDESTISRVVNEKYVQTDFGTFLLKNLFAKAVVTEHGDLLATGHIKEALQQIIDSEDKSNPLTDEELATMLSDRGFRLSRRTISKYRESLDIPTGRMRKELKTDH